MLRMERPAATAGSGVPDPLALAGAVCARVCHDLAGTLGAMAGMLDLVAESQDAEALALAGSCARELTARLQLLRAAWGTDTDVGEIALLARGLPGAERLKLEFGGLAEQRPAMRQLTASLLLVGAGAMPRGGSLRVAGGNNGVVIEMEGLRAAWPQALTDEAAGGTGLEPRAVSALMARLQARALGLVLEVALPGRLEAR